jgi:hypothetical protein
MDDITYTCNKSGTNYAYLPDGRVMEVWQMGGWHQLCLHPAGHMSHHRQPGENPATREAFAAAYTATLHAAQQLSREALPLELTAFYPERPMKVVALVTPPADLYAQPVQSAAWTS